MPITLYHHPVSPCTSSVLLTIKALGIEDLVTEQIVDLAKGEHRAPEYVEKFPMHAIPALEDDGFYLWDSHAIVTYLTNAYGKGDSSLYPKDSKKRAKVDQWLHFSNGILYNRLRDMSEPLWLKKSKVVSEEASERAERAYKLLEDQLQGEGPWLCGADMTLADLCCASQVSSMEVFIGDSKHYPKMSAWVEHCKRHVPGYEKVVGASREVYSSMIRAMMTS